MTAKARLAAAVLGASLVSAGGYALVQHHEGLRYVAYPDPGTGGEPWTICYGHTKGVRPGMTATQEQCDAWLLEDLQDAERHVQRLVRVTLNQNEYDAYTSFVFNVGPSKFASSTMLRKLNSGDRRGACNEFSRWVYANKKVLNGLKKRRSDERLLCLLPSKEIVHHGH